MEEGLLLGLKEDGGLFVREEDNVLLGHEAGRRREEDVHVLLIFPLYVLSTSSSRMLHNLSEEDVHALMLEIVHDSKHEIVHALVEDMYILFPSSACLMAKQYVVLLSYEVLTILLQSKEQALLHGAEHHRRLSAPKCCFSSSVESRTPSF